MCRADNKGDLGKTGGIFLMDSNIFCLLFKMHRICSSKFRKKTCVCARGNGHNLIKKVVFKM